MGRTLVKAYIVISREKLISRLNPWELWEDKKEQMWKGLGIKKRSQGWLATSRKQIPEEFKGYPTLMEH